MRAIGDPCTSRFKVHHDGHWWRVFELAQPGQRVSVWPDARFKRWETAMLVAHDWAAQDRRKCARERGLR